MATQSEDVTSLGGPVERIDGQLTLRIPLSSGADKFVSCTRGIARVEGELLLIEIPVWLAQKLGIVEGCDVVIDNAGGKFNIRRDGAV